MNNTQTLPPAPPPLLLKCAERLAERFAEEAPAIDEAGAFPVEEFDGLPEAGLLTAPLPVDHGGHGMGTSPAQPGALLDVLRALGRGSLSVARLYEGHANALLLVERFGTPRQRERIAAAVRGGSARPSLVADGAGPETC